VAVVKLAADASLFWLGAHKKKKLHKAARVREGMARSERWIAPSRKLTLARCEFSSGASLGYRNAERRSAAKMQIALASPGSLPRIPPDSPSLPSMAVARL